MRRIAFCLYALVLALPLVGCKKEEPAATTPAPTTTDAPAATEPAADATEEAK